MLTFALCDDEPIWFERMAAVFAGRRDLAITTTCYSSGDTLLDDYRDNKQRFDAIFLDIEMPEMDGLALAKALRALNSQVILIFVTSHTRFLKEAIQARPLRFVEKGLLATELPEAIEAIVEELHENSYSLTFTDHKKDVHLYYHEILFIESHKHYVDIHTTTGVYHKRTSLSQLEAELKPGLFCRSHRSYLVNLRYVRTFDEAGVVLRDYSPPSIPIGEKYEKTFRAACKRYFERKEGL